MAESTDLDDDPAVTSRRRFLREGGALMGGVVLANGLVGEALAATPDAGAQTIASAALPSDADANVYTNFCGHTYTTGNCPAPTGLPRIDRNGYPLRASDGVAVDDLGRPVNAAGQPIDAAGSVLTDADGVPLPRRARRSARRPARTTRSNWRSTDRGTAAAAARCGGSATAAA